MSKMVYLNEWAGLVKQARGHRRLFPEITDVFQHDPPPASRYSAGDVEWLLKLVAHWEGGPVPDSPDAVPVELVLGTKEETP